jgi:hypothetical protein
MTGAQCRILRIVGTLLHVFPFPSVSKSFSSIIESKSQSKHDWIGRIETRDDDVQDGDFGPLSVNLSDGTRIDVYHGTTTLAFVFGEDIITAVDSRASLGKFIGSRTVDKVIPVTNK